MPSITTKAWVPKEAPHSFQSTPNDGGRRRNYTEAKGIDTRRTRISDRVENVGARSPLEKRISRIARITSQVATGAAKHWVSESSMPINNSLKRQISRPWDLPSLTSPGTYITSKTRSSTTTNQRRSQTTFVNNNNTNNSSPPSLSNKSDSTDSIANKTAHQCVAHASKRQAAAKAAMNATSHISNILRDLMGDSNRALAVARQSQAEAEEAAARAAGAAKKVKEVSDLAAKDIQRAHLELEEADAQAEEAREFLKRVQSISNSSRRTDENDFAARNENEHRSIPERVRISIDANEERQQTTRHPSALKYPQSPRKTIGAPLSPTGVKKQKSDNNWWNGSSVREQQNLRPPPHSAAMASTTNNSSFIEPIRSFKGHTSPVTQVVAVDKYHFLSSSWDTTIRLWVADTGECTRTYCGHDDWVTAIQVLDSKHFISGSDDRCVKLWSFDAELCIRTFTGHTSFVKSLAPIDSNRFLSGSRDRTIKLFSVSTGDCCQTFTGHTDVISAIAHMGSNKFASGSHDRQVKVWNISSTSSCEQTLVGHGGVIKALAAVSERDLLSGSDDKTIRLWNIVDGSCIREFGSMKNALVFSVIHVCEGFFLSCGGNNIKVYNIRTGKCVKSYETPRVSLAVARLGNERFVTGSDHQLHLWKF